MTDSTELLPPQNLDAEQSVIGSAMLNADAIDETAGLRPEQFYSDANQKTWKAILQLREQKQPVDAVTLAEHLESAGELEDVGGTDYLAELLRIVPHAAHADYYAGIVRDRWTKRRVIYCGTQMIRKAYEPHASTGQEVLGDAQGMLSELAAEVIDLKDSQLSSIVLDLMQEIDSGERDPGAPTGFVDLDKLLIGLRPSNLIILAARPSVGKTAFACNLAINLSKSGCGVAFMSLEQSAQEIAERMLLAGSGVDGHRYRASDLQEHERSVLVEQANQIARLNVHIDDSTGRTVWQIAASFRSLKRKHAVGCVIVDYLQLIEPDNRRDPREQQVARMTQQLKRLAKQENIPVIALAQLNREIEKRKGKDREPRMADLRESGAIEQDADVVMFLDRPHLWGIDEPETLAKLYVKKQRNGKTGTVELNWEDSTMTFRNAAMDYRSGTDF